MKKAEDAVRLFWTVADYCKHFGNRGMLAKRQLQAEIAEGKKEALLPQYADLKDQMLANVTAIEGVVGGMDSFTVPAKEALAASEKLSKALAALKKKPTDKKTMESFSMAIKAASAVCGKLRNTANQFKQKLPKNYQGQDNMRAFVIIVDNLLKYIEAAMPKLAPPRPVQGPPAKP